MKSLRRHEGLHTAFPISLPLVPILIVPGGEDKTQQEEVTLSYVNWEEGVAWTCFFKVVLEDEMGYDVTITAADVGVGYSDTAAGDQDDAGYELVVLEQDEEQIWPLDDIKIMGRIGVNEDFPEVVAFVDNVMWTNETIGSLMVHTSDSNLSALEAARDWKNENRDIRQDWIP